MDELEARLVGCFSTVFPDLSTDEITRASSNSVQNWDSVAGVTLLVVIEEEFMISVELEDLARFNSFDGFLSYLRETTSGRQVSMDSYIA